MTLDKTIVRINNEQQARMYYELASEHNMNVMGNMSVEQFVNTMSSERFNLACCAEGSVFGRESLSKCDVYGYGEDEKPMNDFVLIKFSALFPPKYTKQEFIKVTHKNVWQVVKEYENHGNIFVCEENDGVLTIDCSVDGFDIHVLKEHLQDGNIYRRIELPREPTELELFVEECNKYNSPEEMFKSGKFKLV